MIEAVAANPFNCTVCGEIGALSLTNRLPVSFDPGVTGVYLIWIVQTAPGARLPQLLLVIANTGLDIDALPMERSIVPQFVIFSDSDEVWPTVIAPKYRALAERHAPAFGVESEIFVANACCCG